MDPITSIIAIYNKVTDYDYDASVVLTSPLENN